MSIIAWPFSGIVTEVLLVAGRKPIFGYVGLVAATLAIASLFMAWAHHMCAICKASTTSSAQSPHRARPIRGSLTPRASSPLEPSALLRLPHPMPAVTTLMAGYTP